VSLLNVVEATLRAKKKKTKELGEKREYQILLRVWPLMVQESPEKRKKAPRPY